MKRIIATLTSLLLAFAGLVAMEAPAKADSTRLADVFSLDGGTINTNIGEAVNWDWMSCGGNDASQLYFSSGNLPTGLTWDNGVDYTSTPTGAVTGTPTVAGSWTLSGLNCVYYIGPRSDNLGGGSWNSGSITINVIAPPSPAPHVGIVSQMTNQCEFTVDVTVDVAPINGQGTLTLTNGTSTGIYSIINLSANVNTTFDGSLLNNSVILNSMVSEVQPPSFHCGDNITATFSYTAPGSAEASASASAVVDLPPSTPPVLVVTALNNTACEVSVHGVLPTQPQVGSVKFVVSNGTNSVTANLADGTPNHGYDFTLSMFNVEQSMDNAPQIFGHVSSEAPNASALFCEGNLSFELSYREPNHAIAKATQTNIAVSRLGAAPSASVSATNQNNMACEIIIGGNYATTAAANTLKVDVTGQDGGQSIALTGYAPGDNIVLTFSPLHPSDLSTDSHVASVTSIGGGSVSCNEELTVSLSYKDSADNRTYTSTPATVTPTQPIDPPKYLSVTNLNNDTCSVHVVASVPMTADSGSIALMFGISPDDYTVYHLRDYTAGELIEFTISTDEWNFEQNPNVTSTEAHNNYKPRCGSMFYSGLNWSAMGVDMSSSADGVTPTTSSTSSNPTVSLTMVGGPTCLVAVTITIPTVGTLANELYVGNPSENGASVSYHLFEFDPGRAFTILLPMTDLESVNSPYITGTPSGSGQYHCGSPLAAMVVASFDGYVQASQEMDTITSFNNCYVGTYHFDGDCVPAPRGTFVNTQEANAATPCPVGYNTAGVGSTSPNDCYKVILQVIKGLKAPKAMKFKAQIGLPVLTSAGRNADVTATGSCTATTVRAGTKVAGKKVKVPTVVIQATSVAGNCVVTFTGGEVAQYGPLNQTFTIKVNKKGK